MNYRKKKKIIIISIISAVIVIATVIGTLVYLYLKTDAFKSNDTLFSKYLLQNVENFKYLTEDNSLPIEQLLETNKYTSQIIGDIEYVENKGTSNEKKDSKINDVGIKIDSQIDNANNYQYSNVEIGTEQSTLSKLEYAKQDEKNAIRLYGIKQFIATSNIEQNVSGVDLSSIETLRNLSDIINKISFTEEEKNTLANTYLSVIQINVPNDKFHKQSNASIELGDNQIQANGYYLKLTYEEYNNLCIKLLEQIKEDQIILSKIDSIESLIKENYSEYNPETTLSNMFTQYIDGKIQEIQDNNIGNEEVRITVYEKNMKTVKTTIENQGNIFSIDYINDTMTQIKNEEAQSNIKEDTIIINKTSNNNDKTISIEYESKQDNNLRYDMKISNQKASENDTKLFNTTTIDISNDKYETIINLENNKEIVSEFENQINLEENTISFDTLSDKNKQVVLKAIGNNIQKQLENIQKVVGIEDYINMLQNLQVVENNQVDIPEEGEVTEIEQKRFNSQFEFFIGENLTSDDIKELLDTAKNHLENMKVLLKDGSIKDLDVATLELNNQESRDYEDSISEILLSIKENNINEEKYQNTLSFIEKEGSKKYNVLIQYDNNGLVKLIRIRKQDN